MGIVMQKALKWHVNVQLLPHLKACHVHFASSTKLPDPPSWSITLLKELSTVDTVNHYVFRSHDAMQSATALLNDILDGLPIAPVGAQQCMSRWQETDNDMTGLLVDVADQGILTDWTNLLRHELCKGFADEVDTMVTKIRDQVKLALECADADAGDVWSIANCNSLRLLSTADACADKSDSLLACANHAQNLLVSCSSALAYMKGKATSKLSSKLDGHSRKMLFKLKEWRDHIAELSSPGSFNAVFGDSAADAEDVRIFNETIAALKKSSADEAPSLATSLFETM
jgi:hypothetical protein